MNKAPSLIAAIVLGLGISACGYFVGDGVKHLKTNNRYVNVRGLSEKEVRADTAECKRKLTAVCSHQTRIGNLDAHLI